MYWLIVRQTLVQLGIGVVLGAAGAIGIGKLLQAWLVQTSPADPRTLIATTALLGLVCVAAAFWPARRATRIDPLVALRYE
ncbi:MAG: FtsX-like permease family protein [Vitreimonas sp.]